MKRDDWWRGAMQTHQQYALCHSPDAARQQKQGPPAPPGPALLPASVAPAMVGLRWPWPVGIVKTPFSSSSFSKSSSDCSDQQVGSRHAAQQLCSSARSIKPARRAALMVTTCRWWHTAASSSVGPAAFYATHQARYEERIAQHAHRRDLGSRGVRWRPWTSMYGGSPERPPPSTGCSPDMKVAL